MAPADPKEPYVPKPKENESEFDRSIISYKEIARALEHLHVEPFHQKTRTMRFLRAFLNPFLSRSPLLDEPDLVD